MKRIVRIFSMLCFAAVVLTMTAVVYTAVHLPDNFSVEAGQDLYVDNNIKADILQDVKGSGTISAESVAKAGSRYNATLKMFGVVPIKNVKVSVVSHKLVVPCGIPFGIKMFTDGVVVVGLTDVQTDKGLVNPAQNAGIKVGDIITAIDGKRVCTNEDIVKMILTAGGNPMTVSVRRKNLEFEVVLTPARCENDLSYKAGIWVRDSSAGIGTMTFYDKTTSLFGGLGHPVCDIDTGEILPLMSGEVVNVTITDVCKGMPGMPGELRGSFDSSRAMGYLVTNTQTGLYGMLNKSPVSGEAVPVALKQQIHEGRATILCTVDGSTPKEYKIIVERVNLTDPNPTKNMIIRIDDPELIEATGGIVQGMSGSPFLQDGMLAGAVTHVFINDPTKGYGIFAENMLDSASNMQNGSHNLAS